jgi:hypothetical protein
MRINKFSLQHRSAFISKEVIFSSPVVIIHSGKNSTGKTTLLRAILFALGFPVPNTELIHFEDFEFTLDLTHNNEKIIVTRRENLLTIKGQEFDLPVEQHVAHSFLFGIGNNEILTNLLGTIYFDQEKGWTLLNRGTIIGTNRFNVEGFFRGLKEDESDESYQMVECIDALRKKIAEYRLMLNVAEYQAAVNHDVGQKLDFQTYQEGLNSSIIEKRIQLQNIENEISYITDMMRKNKSFSDYIEMKKIYVNDPHGDEPIRVSKNTLFEYNDLEDVNAARKSVLVAERNTLKREIAAIEVSQEKQITLSTLSTVDAELTSRLANISRISAIEVQSILDKLSKEKQSLSKDLKIRTKQNNTWVTDAYKIIADYAKEIDIPFDYKIDIFTSNLKTKSGTILHKMVFVYKLAYINLLSKKLGYPVPIFCDSPSGREVKSETIAEMLNILQRDFSEHQIFIASIHKYENVFSNAQIYEVDGTLFNEPTLFDLLPQ